MTIIWKTITMLWPFLLEMCAGRRMGFMEAYKAKPKQLLLAMGFSVILCIGLLAMMRLYSLSIEVVERNKEIAELTAHYNQLAKKYNEPLLSGSPLTKVAGKTLTTATPVSEVMPTPSPDAEHLNDVSEALAKIKTDAEK